MIRFSVNGQRLARQSNETIVSDSLNYLSMAFNFSGDWRGLTAWANITAPDGSVIHVVIENGRIPAERGINLTEGTWRMMLHGDALIGDEMIKRITTNSVDIIVSECRFGDGEPFHIDVDDASLVVSKAVAATNDMRALIEDVEQKRDSGAFNGKDGINGSDGKDGADGADGIDGDDGISPVVTVADVAGGHRVTITDAMGSHVFDVRDGERGPAGEQGPTGRQGPPGSDASVTSDSIRSALGYTPADAEEVAAQKESIAVKLDKPTEAPAVGKALRIKSINDDGSFVCEWADDEKGIQLSDIPIIDDQGTAGIARNVNSADTGLVVGAINGVQGYLKINYANESRIASRTGRFPITPLNLNSAVKATLTDPNKMVLSDAEKAAARETIGAGREEKWELIETIDWDATTAALIRAAEPDGTPYNFRKLMVILYTAGSGSTASSSVRAGYTHYSTCARVLLNQPFKGTVLNTSMAVFEKCGEILTCTSTQPVANSSSTYAVYSNPPFEIGDRNIEYLHIGENAAFSATGNTVKIYAVRA